MHRLMLRWFQKYLHADTTSLIAHLLAHIGHREREQTIRMFWQRELGTPPSAFRKTWWVRAPWKREYEDDTTYQGVLTVRIRRSKDRLRMINTWIDCVRQELH